MRKIITILMLCMTFGCDDIFEEDLSKKRVDIIIPTNDAVTQEGEFAFLWRKLYGATGYHLTIVSPSFDKGVLLLTDTIMKVDSLHTGLLYKTYMPPGDYQWSLKALNSSSASIISVYNLSVK